MVYAVDLELEQLNIDNIDICLYWNRVSTIADAVGQKKYSMLSELARCALTLSHVNTIAERGFSVNNSFVTKERASLSENMTVAIHIVQDAIRVHRSSTSVPITKDMIASVMRAHFEYLIEVEKVNKAKQLSEEDAKKRLYDSEQLKAVQKKRDDALALLHAQ